LPHQLLLRTRITSDIEQRTLLVRADFLKHFRKLDRLDAGTIKHRHQTYASHSLVFGGLRQLDQPAHHLRRCLSRDLSALVIEARLAAGVAGLSLREAKGSGSSFKNCNPLT
jgi:hypothetical protein